MATPTQIRRRGRWSLILGTIFAFAAFAAVAYADTVKNNVVPDLSGDKIVTATAGSTASVNYKIDQQPVVQDGQGGCNAADGTPATLSFTGLPAGTTWSPNPFSLDDCTGFEAVTFSVPAGSSGDYNVSVSVSDANTSGGTYTTTDGAFILRVGSSNTTPSIAWATNGNPSLANEGDTKTYNFNITDGDANDSWSFASTPSCGTGGTPTGTPSIDQTAKTGTFQCFFADGPANPTVSVQVKDAANAASNTLTQAVAVSNVKPTPSITSVAGTGGAACSAGNTVTLSFSWTDPALTNDVYDYSVNWGDGSTATTASNATSPVSGTGALQHTYSAGGPYTISVTVNDDDAGAGNSVNSASSFSFLYNVSGILQPINLTGPRSAFKLGSTIPVKLRVLDCDGTTPVPGLTSLAVSLQKVQVGGDPDGLDLEPTSTASPTTGTTMRWDADAGQYIYNLATKGLALSDYQVKVSSAVIAAQTAIITLKK
jgi:PKD domain